MDHYLALMRGGNTAAAERVLREYLASHPPLLDLLNIAMDRVMIYYVEYADDNGDRVSRVSMAHEHMVVEAILERIDVFPLREEDQLPLFQNYARFEEWIDAVDLVDDPINAEARDAFQEAVTASLIHKDVARLGQNSRALNYFEGRLQRVLDAGLSLERCVRLRDAYRPVCPPLAAQIQDYLVHHYLTPAALVLDERLHDAGLVDRHILQSLF
jgi:hypothetical protein